MERHHKNTGDRTRWRSAKECMKLGVTTGVGRSFIVDITEKKTDNGAQNNHLQHLSAKERMKALVVRSIG